MRKFYGLAILVCLISCAPLKVFDLPPCASAEDAGAWIDQNIDYVDDNRIASPQETAETRAGCCIDKALLCLAMARQATGEEGQLILYQTPYGEHATAKFRGFEYGYIEGSQRIGRPFSYRDAMGLIGHEGQIYIW